MGKGSRVRAARAQKLARKQEHRAQAGHDMPVPFTLPGGWQFLDDDGDDLDDVEFPDEALLDPRHCPVGDTCAGCGGRAGLGANTAAFGRTGGGFDVACATVCRTPCTYWSASSAEADAVSASAYTWKMGSSASGRICTQRPSSESRMPSSRPTVPLAVRCMSSVSVRITVPFKAHGHGAVLCTSVLSGSHATSCESGSTCGASNSSSLARLIRES